MSPLERAPRDAGRWPWREILGSLMPITPMGKAMIVSLAVWFLHWTLVDGQSVMGSELLKRVLDLASLLAWIPPIYLLWQGARWVMRTILWRVRRRLIVTYLLIGAIPILLIVCLIVLIGYVVVLQSSASLVSRQLDGYLNQSQAAAQTLSRDLSAWQTNPLTESELRQRLGERVDSLGALFPQLSLTLWSVETWRPWIQVRSIQGSARGDTRAEMDEVSSLPEWLRQSAAFHGLVVEESSGQGAQVYAQHLLKLTHPRPLILQLRYPIGESLCLHLQNATDLNVRPSRVLAPLVLTPQGARIEEEETLHQTEGNRTALWPPGSMPIYKPTSLWLTGRHLESDVLLLDVSFLQPGKIRQRIEQFKSGSAIGNILVLVIGGLGVLFFLIALTATFSAILLTRSITGAVEDLYGATQHVKQGDFEYLIPHAGEDQLGELSVSFNQMTRSIRELLRVSAEKQRLDQEMKIAAQVQARLFPRRLPRSRILDFAPGICLPARSVSGDYYDFIENDETSIGVVIADVCGKGVSAALMMANLQANLHSQIEAALDLRRALHLPPEEAGEMAKTLDESLGPVLAGPSVKRIVQRVNAQIVHAMMDANYITFFYGNFDEERKTLSYTNAGHNAPMVFRAGPPGARRVERLEVGGTVLGLFQEAEYDEAVLPLSSGDLLLAFTDGLIEARNPDNEEYGEDRVMETVWNTLHLPAAEIERALLQSVREWIADAAQEDDLTIVLFKVK